MSSLQILAEGFAEDGKGGYLLYIHSVRVPETGKIGWMPQVVGFAGASMQNGTFYPESEREQALADGKTMLQTMHAEGERAFRTLRLRTLLFDQSRISIVSAEFRLLVEEALELLIDRDEITRLTGFTFEDTPPA